MVHLATATPLAHSTKSPRGAGNAARTANSRRCGAYRFPKNAVLTTLDATAKAARSSTGNAVETIQFGRWRD
jgi:hypothetical protein